MIGSTQIYLRSSAPYYFMFDYTKICHASMNSLGRVWEEPTQDVSCTRKLKLVVHGDTVLEEDLSPLQEGP